MLGDILEIWTPTEVQNYANLVANGFKTMALDIRGNTRILTPAELTAWNALYADFINFYNGIGFFSRLSMATVRSAERYASQLAFWRKTFTAKGGKPTGAEVVVETMSESAQGTAKFVAVAVTVSILSIAAIYMVHKFKR